jgi:hypothetical protein
MADTLLPPASADDLTPAFLTRLLGRMNPGTVVESVAIVEAHSYGEQMVSTSSRAIVDVAYGASSPAGMNTRLVVKMGRGFDTVCAPLYANEVAFYTRLRPELDIEAPRVFGGLFDPESTRFALVLEDLRQRSVHFPNVTEPVTVEQVRRQLDTLARLWESPRFKTDLAWVETHLEGGVERLMNGLTPDYIDYEIEHENFKREMVERLRTTGPRLLAGVQAVQRHQATLPRTLLHGDTHLGNVYRLPDDTGGLLDWQLSVRGHAVHDVSYFITTALSIGARRREERDLLGYYLERLGEFGVTQPPAFEDFWLEYRRAVVWGVYIGWLTTPVVNYGWEINVLNHLRLTTAFEDHETGTLVDAML